MSYQIQITHTAEQDLVDSLNYIEFILKNPSAADHLLNLFTERVNSLADNPTIYPIIDDNVLKSLDIRYLIINNYLAFYTVDEKNNTIYIVRFLYKKRDWITILTENINE